MTSVLLTRVAVKHPPYWIEQEAAARQIGAVTGEMRRVLAVSRGTGIRQRAVCVPPDQIGLLGGIEERNRIYRELAPALAIAATSDVACGRSIGCVVSSSCTGYMVPSWDVRLATELGFNPHTVRLPITEAGCAGGVVAMARAAEHLRLHPDQTALAVSVELCSLAFHPKTEPGNLTAALIFGDGAGAALLETAAEGTTDGLEIVDSLSTLVPCSSDALGFDLTDAGFYPVLQRELVDILPGPTRAAVDELLRACTGSASTTSGSAWYIPAAPASLQASRGRSASSRSGCAGPGSRCGSAAICRPPRSSTSSGATWRTAPRLRGWGLVIAFGPGVSIEMLLVRRC